MAKTKRATVERISRTDAILHLRQLYTGTLDSPAKHNKAFARVLRDMADAVEKVKDAWADPELLVWMHIEGEVTAELGLSPLDDD